MVESRAVLQELAESIRNTLHSIRSSLENRLSSSNSDTQKLINSLELSVSSLRNEMESRTTRLQEEFTSDLSELRDRIRNTEKSISSRYFIFYTYNLSISLRIYLYSCLSPISILTHMSMGMMSFVSSPCFVVYLKYRFTRISGREETWGYTRYCANCSVQRY